MPDGKPTLRNLLGDASPVRPRALDSFLSLNKETEWRYPNRPTIQITLPYLFIADEPVYMSQLPPFLHLLDNPWPGTLFGGRFPIDVWPRVLTWAFEWHDISKPLVLKRGDPWFYVMFESNSPERPIQLVEVENTPELQSYVKTISGAVNFVNQTFSLFGVAASRRPKKLLKEVQR
jgi:hypothetical protein